MMRRAILAVLAAAGCGHGEPYSSAVTLEPNQPVVVAGVQRLTFGPNTDYGPRWLDSGTIGFSYRPLGRADRDRCLARLSLAILRIAGTTCHAGQGDGDSTNAITLHALSPQGRLAYLYETGSVIAATPGLRSLRVATAARPESAAVVMTFPYTVPGGLTHQTAMQMDWLDENRIIYLAAFVFPRLSPFNDTLPVSFELAVVDVAGGPPTVVPNSRPVASVAVNPVNGEVFVSLKADSVVYRLDVATGALQPVYDFGPLGPVRWLAIRGTRLAGVVRGREANVPAVLAGISTLFDYGGEPFVVDLPAGTPQPLTMNEHWFRGLHFDPTGTMLVGEGAPLTIVSLPTGPDTTVQRTTNLWLWRF